MSIKVIPKDLSPICLASTLNIRPQVLLAGPKRPFHLFVCWPLVLEFRIRQFKFSLYGCLVGSLDFRLKAFLWDRFLFGEAPRINQPLVFVKTNAKLLQRGQQQGMGVLCLRVPFWGVGLRGKPTGKPETTLTR